MPRLLPALLLLFALSQALAAPQPLQLSAQAGGVNAQGKVGVLIDPDGRLDIAALRRLPAERFSYPPWIRISHDPRPYWLRLDVSGPTGPSWVLELSAVAEREARVYGPFDEAGLSQGPDYVMGFGYPYRQRPLASENVATPFRLATSGHHTLFIRLQSELPHHYQVRIYESGEYSKAVRVRQLIDGLCYGVLAAMLAYNLFLLLIFADRAHAWYVAAVGMALLSVVSYNGHAAHYLFPDSPLLSQACYSLAPCLWVVAGLMFGRHFLNLHRHSPRLYRLNQVLIAFIVLLPLGAAFGKPGLTQAGVELGAAFSTVLMLCAALIALRRGYHPARWYLVGQLTLFSSVLLAIGHNRGLIDMPQIHALGLQIGASVEVILFALALGSRLRLMQRRHLALRARTTELATAAETDPLTGIANRLGLQARAEEMLQHGQHTVVLIDLNRFKPINDQLGHAAGDQVLIEIARRLDEQLRDNDVVARIGGDEFVVMLCNLYQREVLANIAVRLIDRIGMPIRVDGQMLEVGSSLGLAIYPEHGCNLDTLLRRADAAMYEVKASQHAGFAFADELDARSAAPLSDSTLDSPPASSQHQA